MFPAPAGMCFEIESLENAHSAAIDVSGFEVASLGRHFVATHHGPLHLHLHTDNDSAIYTKYIQLDNLI